MSESKKANKSFNPNLMIFIAKSLQDIAIDLNKPEKSSQLNVPMSFGKSQTSNIILTLAIEIALKALWCIEQNKKPPQIHDLLNLYEKLETKTKEMLETRMRKISPNSIWADVPDMQNLTEDQQDVFRARQSPLRDVLCSHRDANIHWRFIYEDPFGQFETAEIQRALEVIIEVCKMKCSEIMK